MGRRRRSDCPRRRGTWDASCSRGSPRRWRPATNRSWCWRAPPARSSDINVTPLVDVVLVLLIIFMVVTPLLHRGKDVRLPLAHNAAEEKAGLGPLVVSLTADKGIYWATDRIDLEELAARVAAALNKS